MSIREVVRLFIPPIYYKVKNKITSEQRIIDSPLPEIKRNSEKIIIIGNGPSLNKSVELYKEEIIKYDRICVNFFGSSDLYEVLKPNIYVFADPAFFWIPENQKESMEKLFNSIISKTTWNLHIFIPQGAKGAPMEEKLSQNKHIIIDYFNSSSGKIEGLSKFEAWDKNLACPVAMNVLNIAVYLTLFWAYKETYLIGADSSFIENLRIDQETNQVFTMDKHFYENKSVYDDKTLFDEKSRRNINNGIAEELRFISVALANYNELAEYAKYKGLKVYNASEYSWIDAFERKKFEHSGGGNI